jgi:hypothetical protein
MKVPLLYLRDKQVFTKAGGAMHILGKPLGVAKDMKEQGIKLIHFVDLDGMSGMSNNLDVFDGLTFIINVQVEVAPRENLVRKLLSLKCRVVLPPDAPVDGYRDKNLLVARIPPGYSGDAAGFHDVILEDADEKTAKRFVGLGKRVMIFEKDASKVKDAWGIISSS